MIRRCRTSLAAALSSVALLAGLTACTIGDGGNAGSTDASGSQEASVAAEATSDEEGNGSGADGADNADGAKKDQKLEETSVTFRSVGDILIHNEVYFDAAAKAAQEGGQGYDFAPMFAPVKKYMENADITTANMEVPVAGPEFELSGYPAFNSPPEIVDALKGAGVDIVNNATNHSMDRGRRELRRRQAICATAECCTWAASPPPRIVRHRA